MISFTIPCAPMRQSKREFCQRFGRNAYYSGKRCHLRKKDAQELHRLASMRTRVRREVIHGPAV